MLRVVQSYFYAVLGWPVLNPAQGRKLAALQIGPFIFPYSV